jgi:DNA-directed RNA polymerase subunit RPC12/RpoP
MPVPPSARSSGGPSNAVKCAHCGKPNDCRPLLEMGILESGADVECDHCHHMNKVIAVKPVTVVSVRQHPTIRGPVRSEQAAAPATTINPLSLTRRR